MFLSAIFFDFDFKHLVEFRINNCLDVSTFINRMCEYFITCLGNHQDFPHLYCRDLERQHGDSLPRSDHFSGVINMDPALGTL